MEAASEDAVEATATQVRATEARPTASATPQATPTRVPATESPEATEIPDDSSGEEEAIQETTADESLLIKDDAEIFHVVLPADWEYDTSERLITAWKSADIAAGEMMEPGDWYVVFMQRDALASDDGEQIVSEFYSLSLIDYTEISESGYITIDGVEVYQLVADMASPDAYDTVLSAIKLPEHGYLLIIANVFIVNDDWRPMLNSLISGVLKEPTDNVRIVEAPTPTPSPDSVRNARGYTFNVPGGWTSSLLGGLTSPDGRIILFTSVERWQSDNLTENLLRGWTGMAMMGGNLAAPPVHSDVEVDNVTLKISETRVDNVYKAYIANRVNDDYAIIFDVQADYDLIETQGIDDIFAMAASVEITDESIFDAPALIEYGVPYTGVFSEQGEIHELWYSPQQGDRIRITITSDEVAMIRLDYFRGAMSAPDAIRDNDETPFEPIVYEAPIFSTELHRVYVSSDSDARNTAPTGAYSILIEKIN